MNSLRFAGIRKNKAGRYAVVARNSLTKRQTYIGTFKKYADAISSRNAFQAGQSVVHERHTNDDRAKISEFKRKLPQNIHIYNNAAGEQLYKVQVCFYGERTTLYNFPTLEEAVVAKHRILAEIAIAEGQAPHLEILRSINIEDLDFWLNEDAGKVAAPKAATHVYN